MMRRGGETRRGGGRARQGVAPLRQARQGAARRAARRRVRARRPRDVPHVGPDGQAVRQDRHLRRDVRLPARLRRPLPLDAPEADHRQPLRERLRGDEGERADRIRQDPSRAVEDHDRSTVSPRRTSRCTRTSTWARSPSSWARRPRASARTARGPGCDPRGGRCLMAGVVHIPWYATVFRGDKFEAALEEIAPLALALRRDRVRRLPLARRRSTSSSSWRPSRTRPTSSATGTARSSRLWRADYSELLPGAGALRLARPGRARAGDRRARGAAHAASPARAGPS